FDVDAPLRPLTPTLSDEAVAQVAEELNRLTAEGIEVRVADEVRRLDARGLRMRLDLDDSEGLPEPAFDLESLQAYIESTFEGVQLGGRDPVFDVVDGEPVLVEEGSPPLDCCREDAAEVVARAVLEGRPGPVVVEAKPIDDPQLVAWAKGEGVVEKVAEFTTNHACCEARVQNIHRFADLVRGVYLLPGESLSLNEHVGERTREKGFVPAGTIIRGHLVPTVGGGVSQFATTLFNAAFFAGFDFVTYQSHSLYISRYPYGREATISWPAPDLEIQNTTDYPALIWTSYTDTSITVEIYSTKHIEVEQTRQVESSVRACTRVDTYRVRRYPDGREVEDSVFAVYRPSEGFGCNANPADRPDLCRSLASLGPDLPGAPGRDHARVETGQVGPPGEAGVLDLEATVLDHLQAGFDRPPRRLVVAQPQLEPHHLRPDGDRLLHHLRQVLGLPEAIDDVGHLRQVGEARVAAHPQHLVVVGVDRVHPQPGPHQIGGHEVRGAQR